MMKIPSFPSEYFLPKILKAYWYFLYSLVFSHHTALVETTNVGGMETSSQIMF